MKPKNPFPAYGLFVINCFYFEANPAIRYVFYCAALHKSTPLLSGLGHLDCTEYVLKIGVEGYFLRFAVTG